MRNISFALTTQQIRDRTKTVTRRLGWKNLKPGTLLCGVVKGMGLKPGEEIERLAIIRVKSAWREPLIAISYPLRPRSMGEEEAEREGFPGMSGRQFMNLFCEHMGCDEETEVTRIEFEYVPGGRF